MRPRVIGIDPSLTSTGVAFFDGERWHVKTVRSEASDYGIELAPRLTEIWSGVMNFLTGALHEPVDVLVIEKMNVNDKRVAKKQHLISISLLSGALMAFIPAKRTYLPVASTWKGSVPKAVHHRRLKKEVPELAGKRISGDAWDAVGLALYGRKKYALSQT